MGDGPRAAVDALSTAVGAEPGRGDLWGELATALVAAGRASEAWDAAVRAVELAPRSAASHRAIGTVAAALGDTAQADAAYRHAALLDPTGAAGSGAGRHAADRAGDLAARTASQITGSAPGPGRRRAPDPEPPRPDGSRHAAPEEAPAAGRHGLPQPPTGRLPETAPDSPPAQHPPAGGRRRAPEDSEPPPQSSGGRRTREEGPAPAVLPGATGAEGGPPRAGWRAGTGANSGPGTAVWPAGTGEDGGAGTAVWPVGAAGHGVAAGLGGAAGPVREVRRGTAVGLPAWLGPPGAPGRMPAGATRATDPESWRRGLITVVRVEWLAGVACFLGLAYARSAPYTAGLLAGALVVVGAYARLRRPSIASLRPPDPDRIPTYAAVAAVTTAVVIIPAAMAGTLTLARLAAVLAVTCATIAAVLLARAVGRDVPP